MMKRIAALFLADAQLKGHARWAGVAAAETFEAELQALRVEVEEQQALIKDERPIDWQITMLSWFFQWAFCTAGATIVSGAVAERVKSPTYAAYALIMTSFIYPVVVAWTWGGGWLATVFDVSYMDFAGSGIVHLTGGVSGLAGTVVLGPRKGRFVNPEEFEPHNLPLVVLGTFALWFGWWR
eukprot:g18426.t1